MENNIIDAKKLSPEKQAFLREMIVRLHLMEKTEDEINVALGASISLIRWVCHKYKKGGTEAISLKTMGRPAGKIKHLTSEQIEELKTKIINQKPEDFDLKGFLWDNKNIKKLIFDFFKVEIPRSTLSKYLASWGFTAQRPIIYNRKQNPEHIEKWLNETYPEIKSRAKNESCEIFWGDEVGVQNECNYAKGYAPKGKTPTAKLTHNKSFRINMISAIANTGKLRFMMYEKTMTQQLLIVFMRRLIKSIGKKIFLILDNLKVHHGKIVKQFLAENADKIEVFYLPTYSPELNPDEYFNNALKREIEKNGDATSKKKLKINARAATQIIQNNQLKVSKFFQAKKVKYAA